MAQLDRIGGLVSKMTRFLLIALFSILSSSAFAQCTGIFGTNTVCGVTTSGPPGPIAFTTISGTGTINQLAYYTGTNTLGGLAKGNLCVYGTDGSGVPACRTTFAAAGVSGQLQMSDGSGHFSDSAINVASGSTASGFGVDSTHADIWLNAGTISSPTGLVSLSGGIESSSFGFRSLESLTTPTNLNGVTAYGALSLRYLKATSTTSYVTAFGNAAGGGLASGAGDVTLVGAHTGICMTGNTITLVGAHAGNEAGGGGPGCTSETDVETGIANIVGIGNLALNSIQSSTTGETFIGAAAGQHVTTGISNAGGGSSAMNALTTGQQNACWGELCLHSVITGSNNTALGFFAGLSALGSSNIFIGAAAGQNETGSNKLYIDVTNTATPLIGGDFSAHSLTFTASGGVTDTGAFINTGITTDAAHTDATVCEDTTTHQFYFGSGAAGICLGTSSIRFKHDIAELHQGLTEILKLTPVEYKLNADHGDPDHKLYGFTAEQGETALPELVGRDKDGQPQTFDYMGVVPVLVRAIQQQQAEIEELKRKVK